MKIKNYMRKTGNIIDGLEDKELLTEIFPTKTGIWDLTFHKLNIRQDITFCWESTS